MRIAVVAKSGESLEKLRAVFARCGCTEDAAPEYVLVIGGDGTLLRAEREYPGIPKVPIKDSQIGKLYSNHSAEEMLSALAEKRFHIEERIALDAVAHGKTYRAANDVIIRNSVLTQAIRFMVDTSEQFNGAFIGDGVVIATPLGSTAYYQSITRTTFDEGVGIAFNNIIQLHDVSPHFSEDACITVTITRGPAELGVDNSVHTELLQDGDFITVQKSCVPVRIVRLR